MTQRQSVLDAITLANKGYNAKEICDKLTEVKMQSDIYITVATLEYLKKGGRITAAAAALGGMLRLKPILQIKGEKLDKYKMRNNNMDKAKTLMMDAIEESVNGFLKDIDGRTDNVFLEVAYSGTDKTQVNDFLEKIKERFPGHVWIHHRCSSLLK